MIQDDNQQINNSFVLDKSTISIKIIQKKQEVKVILTGNFKAVFGKF